MVAVCVRERLWVEREIERKEGRERERAVCVRERDGQRKIKEIGREEKKREKKKKQLQRFY